MADADLPVHLFVYGTLRRAAAHPMHGLLQPATFAGRGSFPGKLFSLGAYPGAVEIRGSTARVWGELYHLHDPAVSLARLDRYEGCSAADAPPHDYVRVTLPIQMAAEPILAWVYLYHRPVSGLTPVPSGDWLRRSWSGASPPADA